MSVGSFGLPQAVRGQSADVFGVLHGAYVYALSHFGHARDQLCHSNVI